VVSQGGNNNRRCFIGFLSRLFRPKPNAGAIDRIEMLRKGYKENFEGKFFPPDTVWAAPGSKVYHVGDHCTGTGGQLMAILFRKVRPFAWDCVVVSGVNGRRDLYP